MRELVTVAVTASVVFLGTMFDNYFAYLAQVVVTEREHHHRLARAQVLAVTSLVLAAAALGTALHRVGVRWFALLAIAPLALAWRSWRAAPTTTRDGAARAGLKAFLITVALGGDNVAIWMPQLRFDGTRGAVVSVLTFAWWDALVLLSAHRAGRHPRVAAWGERIAPRLLPVIYLVLAALIIVECHPY